MISIPKSIIEAIIKQSVRELPNEACGLLTGKHNEVLSHYELTNTDHSPEHFSFNPQEQFDVLKKAKASGQKIIANYHSHPLTPARPSEEDIRLAYDKNILYVIISLAQKEPAIKAFRIYEGSVEIEDVVITEHL